MCLYLKAGHSLPHKCYKLLTTVKAILLSRLQQKCTFHVYKQWMILVLTLTYVLALAGVLLLLSLPLTKHELDAHWISVVLVLLYVHTYLHLYALTIHKNLKPNKSHNIMMSFT